MKLLIIHACSLYNWIQLHFYTLYFLSIKKERRQNCRHSGSLFSFIHPGRQNSTCHAEWYCYCNQHWSSVWPIVMQPIPKNDHRTFDIDTATVIPRTAKWSVPLPSFLPVNRQRYSQKHLICSLSEKFNCKIPISRFDDVSLI